MTLVSSGSLGVVSEVSHLIAIGSGMGTSVFLPGQEYELLTDAHVHHDHIEDPEV